jgi:hypothetical protein
MEFKKFTPQLIFLFKIFIDIARIVFQDVLIKFVGIFQFLKLVIWHMLRFPFPIRRSSDCYPRVDLNNNPK